MKIRKGIICAAPLYKDFVTDRFVLMFERLKEEYDIEIQFTLRPILHRDTNFVLAFSAPTYIHPNAMINLLDVGKDVKIVGWLSDIHDSDGVEKYRENMWSMLERYDIILTPAVEALVNEFPELIEKIKYKLVFFPMFLPEYYLELPFYKKPPTPKCLLSGSMDKNFYPIRNWFRENFFH